MITGGDHEKSRFVILDRSVLIPGFVYSYRIREDTGVPQMLYSNCLLDNIWLSSLMADVYLHNCMSYIIKAPATSACNKSKRRCTEDFETCSSTIIDVIGSRMLFDNRMCTGSSIPESCYLDLDSTSYKESPSLNLQSSTRF